MHKSENQVSEPPKPDTRVYFEGFCLFRKKIGENKVLPLLNHFLKIQWEIHFFDFLNADRNAPKKFNSNMDNLISNLLSELIFAFGKWSN